MVDHAWRVSASQYTRAQEGNRVAGGHTIRVRGHRVDCWLRRRLGAERTAMILQCAAALHKRGLRRFDQNTAAAARGFDLGRDRAALRPTYRGRERGA